VGGLGPTIAAKAAGNPFFAEEIVRELAGRGVLQGQPKAYISTAEVADVSVPATLQATIAARIDRLDPNAKRTLSGAAVIGSRFDLDLLTVLGIEPVVADLVAAQFIDQVRFTRQHEYVFHYPLIRAVAYESQLKSDRTELHRAGGCRNRTTQRRIARRECRLDCRAPGGRRRSPRSVQLAHARRGVGGHP
jgi:adenylate cyclase